MAKRARPKKRSPEKRRLRYDFIKSNFFRVIHADGAFGGPNPSGGVTINFFSERLPIPKAIVHEVLDDDTLGPEIRDKREQREGVVREFEASVQMDHAAAKRLLTWLERHLETLDQAHAPPPKEVEKT